MSDQSNDPRPPQDQPGSADSVVPEPGLPQRNTRTDDPVLATQEFVDAGSQEHPTDLEDLISGDDAIVAGGPVAVTDTPETDQDTDTADTELADTGSRIPTTKSGESEPETTDPEPESDAVTRTSLHDRTSTVTPAAETETTLVRRHSLMNSASAPDTPAADSPAWTARPHDSATPAAPAPLPLTSTAQLESVMFDGATLSPVIPKRIGGRFWSVLLTIIGVPTAWLAFTEYADRYMEHFPSSSGTVNTELLTQDMWSVLLFVLGIAAIILVYIAARLSSLGAWIVGTITTIIGAIALVIPNLVASALQPQVEAMRSTDSSTAVRYLGKILDLGGWSAHNGMIFVIGIALLFLAFVSYGARRGGRRDMMTRSVVATDGTY